MLDAKRANNIMLGCGRAMYNHNLRLANSATNDVATFSSSHSPSIFPLTMPHM